MIKSIKKFLWFLNIIFYQLLRVDFIRFIIVYGRYLYFFKIKKNFKTFYPIDHVSDNMPGSKKENLSTVRYNASYTKEKNFFEIYNQFSGYRSYRLVAALSVSFAGSEKLRNMKCLSIGPQTEGEIFSFVAQGSKLKDIYSIDIQTYSPRIIPGDACNLPFEDDFFDCIVAGWVFPYIVDKEKAAQEIIRVCKDGAYVALSHSWYPENDVLSNGDFSNGQNISSNKDLLNYFLKYIKHIVVDFDQSKINPNIRGDLLTIFQIKKDKI